MDRDPKHTAKKSLEYMNDAQINYYADWPPRSPDFNPIENIWGLWRKSERNYILRILIILDKLFETFGTD